MKILVAIDDTDNLESRGTGELASLLAKGIEEKGWGQSGFVTRHQLLVHPDIPYTSHNSAMCFAAELEEDRFDPFIAYATSFLGRESAPGSDPGLCVAEVESLRQPEDLIAFGRTAKKEVLDKASAYALAQRLGIHLSEHGGTGHGVIGALAGAGLRLAGDDGRLKGKLALGKVGETLPVRTLLKHPLIEAVQGVDGSSPAESELVELGEKIKTVLLGGRSVLLLEPAAEGSRSRWRTCPLRFLKSY